MVLGNYKDQQRALDSHSMFLNCEIISCIVSKKRRFCWLKKDPKFRELHGFPFSEPPVRREPIYWFGVHVSGVPFVGGSAGQVCHRASVLIVEAAPRMALQSGKKIYNLSKPQL